MKIELHMIFNRDTVAWQEVRTMSVPCRSINGELVYPKHWYTKTQPMPPALAPLFKTGEETVELSFTFKEEGPALVPVSVVHGDDLITFE